MSFSETIFLFFVALLIFGPKKLPEIGRQVGKILNDFKRASNEFKAQIESEITRADLENQRKEREKQWQDKPKNTVMLPTAPPEGTVSVNSAAPEPISAPAPANTSTDETVMVKANADA